MGEGMQGSGQWTSCRGESQEYQQRNDGEEIKETRSERSAARGEEEERRVARVLERVHRPGVMLR
jgi:hypothetical protein